eukprot:c17121_g1_i1.p1 GENE.c17121_g1_i1~~c17121_g1_i1.p1  ORF type:complete len:342 (+),score=133.96 c17121_g1_i1:28-1053(+)
MKEEEGFETVQESAEFIAKNSKDVFVNQNEIEKIAPELEKIISENPIYQWGHQLLPNKEDNNCIQWIFLLDTLNFCFWSPIDATDDEKFTIEYNQQKYTGYWALCAAIKKALDKGIPLLDANFMEKGSEEDWKIIFQSSTKTPIPQFEKRIELIKEIGKELNKNFEGNFINAIKQSNNSSKKLIEIVLKHFPSYRDECFFLNKKIKIHKRVQILIADIWSCFSGKDFGLFNDINLITMFADYRVPQALVGLGLMSYSERLFKKLSNGEIIQSGSNEEIEIRGCSVYAVECLRNVMKNKKVSEINQTEINAIIIDFCLWNVAKERSNEYSKIPIHRTITHFY